MIKNNKISFRDFLPTYLFTAIYVSVCCFFLSHLGYDKLYLVPLLWIEWLVVLCSFVYLAPWLGMRRMVLYGGFVFIFAHFVTYITLPEVIATYGSYHSGSDDFWYLLRAEDVFLALQPNLSSPISGWHAYLDATSGDWSLGAWPFILGLVSSIFGYGFSDIHPIALSLNASFLAISLAAVFNFCESINKNRQHILFCCFLALSCEPFVFAAMSRKESLLQMLLLLFFVGIWRGIGVQFKLSWLTLAAISLVGVLGVRPGYIPILFGLALLAHLQTKNYKIGRIIVVSLIFIGISYGILSFFEIRGMAYSKVLSQGNASFRSATGIGSIIYNVPFAGPFLFYIVAPIPSNIFNFDISNYYQQLLRSIGTLLYVCSFLYVAAKTIGRPDIVFDKKYQYVMYFYVALFVATVIAADDPRYKQPTNYYLAIMLYCVIIGKSKEDFSV